VKIEALVLLEDNLPACRMVVTWHLAHARIDKLTEDHIDQPFPEQSRYQAWEQVSGLDATTVERLAEMLWVNDICHEDGTVDETAMGLVRTRLQSLI